MILPSRKCKTLFKTTGLSLKSDLFIGMLFQNQQGGGCISQILFFKHILPYFPTYYVSPAHNVSVVVYGTLLGCIFSLLMSLTAFWSETRTQQEKTLAVTTTAFSGKSKKEINSCSDYFSWSSEALALSLLRLGGMAEGIQNMLAYWILDLMFKTLIVL